MRRAGATLHQALIAGDGRTNSYKSQFVKGFDMTSDERADLLAFLRSLTDSAFLERTSTPESIRERATGNPMID